MKKSTLKILMLLCIFLLTTSISFSAELIITPKDGQLWTEAKGNITVINMAAVKGTWEELALKLDDGEIIILIGEPTIGLKGKAGEALAISGVLKPRMRYQGNLVRVIEIKEIK